MMGVMNIRKGLLAVIIGSGREKRIKGELSRHQNLEDDPLF